MKTYDLQSAGPSASLVQTVESPENKETDLDDPETATEGDIQTQYSDGLCSPHIAVTLVSCKNFSQHMYCLKIQHLSSVLIIFSA